MAYSFSLGDVAYLRSGAGVAALAEVSALPLTDPIASVAAVRRLVGAEHAAAVLETVLLRRKAASKVDTDGWLFTSDALQQASATPVARHRAARLAGLDVHDVTCSVGADLVEIARVARRALGSDLDPVRLEMARHNGTAAGVAFGSCAPTRCVRPAGPGSSSPTRPGGTAAGRRAWRPADFAPPLGRAGRRLPGASLAIKCAPGLDFALTPWADEVELVSLDGQVRESCLWRGLGTGVTRRATVLRSDGTQWTVTDAEPDELPAREPGEWIVDPDGAVVRAGLVRHYAARHGLWQMDERIAYLTGDTPPPGVRAFRVLEHGPVHREGAEGRPQATRRRAAGDPGARPGRRPGRVAAAAETVRWWRGSVGRADPDRPLPVAFLCRAADEPRERKYRGSELRVNVI